MHIQHHLDLSLQVLLEKIHGRHGKVGVRLVQVVWGHREGGEDVRVPEDFLLGLLEGDGANVPQVLVISTSPLWCYCAAQWSTAVWTRQQAAPTSFVSEPCCNTIRGQKCDCRSGVDRNKKRYLYFRPEW